MDAGLFDDAAEIVRSMLPDDYADVQLRPRRWGLKAWFGGATPTRLHYEAQVIAPHDVEGAEVLAIEVGFHLEERTAQANDEVLASLVAQERRWRRALGGEATAGPFLGRPDDWRRVSETWPDPDLDDPEVALELGARVVDYIVALEPHLR